MARKVAKDYKKFSVAFLEPEKTGRRQPAVFGFELRFTVGKLFFDLADVAGLRAGKTGKNKQNRDNA